MENKKLTTSLVASLLIATNLYSNELSTITVTSPLIETNEKDATYSTEIYTKEDIQKSKSKDVYEFLNSQTSVNVAPNFGNTFTQKIDIRGYGIGDGYQNVVLTINGRRLNNIDGSPQLLSSIPVESIEKIEIIKGSGSVQYGDGANAGVINIITNGKNDNYIKSYIGSNGTKNGTVSLGYSNDKFILNGFFDYTSTDGTRSISDGSKDKNYNKNKNLNLIYFPTDNIELRASRTYSNMNTKYGGPLSLIDYKSNPNSSPYFTEQYFSSYVTELGLTYDINRDVSLELNYNDENKVSEYKGSYPSQYRYDYESFNSKININDDNYKLVVGVDGFNGKIKKSSGGTPNKKNKALFVSNEYSISKNTLFSAAVRREQIEYNLDNNINNKSYLNAYDLGINYKINKNSSIFANYNRAYQAPDLDRLYWYGTFVGFIEPSKADNFNIGYTNVTGNNKAKISLFRTNLKNEIYFHKTGLYTGKNTNIDKSHKYGFELFDKYVINDNLYTSLNYSYIIAKIDEEDEGSGAYNGKYLPGVSKHNITLNVGYKYKNLNSILSHTYRSSTFASNDFNNNFSQKQEAYNSTDLSFNYDYKSFEFFAKVKNLFDKKNGLWISNDNIYPINFERTYQAGVKYKF